MLEPEQGGWLDDVMGELTNASQSVTADPTAAPPSTEPAAPAPAASPPDSPDAGSASPVESSPVGPPSTEPAQAPPEAAAVPAATPPTTEEPFAFRAGISLPGAVKMADGSLRLPADKVATLERVLSSERALQRQAADLRTQLQGREQSRSEKDAQSDMLIESLERIMSLPDAPNQQPGEARVIAFLDLCEKYPKLKSERTIEFYKEQMAKTQQQGSAAVDQQDWTATQDEFWVSLSDAVAEIIAKPEYAALKGKEADVLAELKAQQGSVFRDPADRAFKYKTDVFARTLTQMAAIERRIAKERETWEQRTKLEQRNAAVLTPTKAPVTPSAATPPAAPPNAQPGKPSRDEYRKSMDDDESFADSLR